MAKQIIDTKAALKDKLKGMSMADIGRKQGVTRAAVQKHLKPLLEKHCRPEELTHYQENQADILDALAAGILGSITPANLRKASLQQKVNSVSALVANSRLIRGQSTNNSISVLLARHVHALEVVPSTRPIITIDEDI